MQTWEASFGDIDLSPTADNGDVTVEVHGLKRGKHTRITAVADSLIQDGSIERVVRDDNRDVQLILCLDGTDSEALAQFEATLFREVNRGRNEFRWTPPDGFGATAVFDVLWADLAFADEDTVWDLDEIRGRRNYVLTMRCLPFARSVDPFTASGVTSAATPVTTVINEATSVTGWFGEPAGGGTRYTPGQSGSEVFVDIQKTTPAYNPTLVYKPAAPVDMTGTTYLNVYWRTTNIFPHNQIAAAYADGTPLSQVAYRYLGGYGVYGAFVFTYVCADTSVGEFEFEPPAMSGYTDGATTGTFRIDKIEKSNQGPSTGSLRQKSIVVDVPGSARTPASLEVLHATSGLGNVLVYTSASLGTGYAPPMSPFRTSPTGNDSGTVSGKRGTGATYSIPASLLPGGQYQLVVRHEINVTYSSSAVLKVGGTSVGVAQSGAKSVQLMGDDGTAYTIHTHGTFSLPPHEVALGTSATVELTLTTATGSGQIDEVWLFHMPDDGSAHLSTIPVGARKRLWLDAATVDRPYPACYIGDAADRSDAFGANGATSNWDEHIFPAGRNEVFVVTTTALDAMVELEGSARWLTHPAA